MTLPTRPHRLDERLTPGNAALVPIDHQSGLLSACRDIPTERLHANIVALAKVCRAFGLPTVLTQGWSN